MSVRDAPLHVACACDESYVVPLGAMLASLDAQLGEGRRAVVHVLARGLREAERRQLRRCADEGRIELRWAPIDASEHAPLARTLRAFDTVSLATYDRLLLPEVLPAEVSKVLYLDCDLVVCRDPGELWDHELGDALLLAVPELDPRGRLVSSELGLRLHRELDLPPDLEVFNAGVLLIDLRRWREELVATRALVYLRECAEQVRWHDQEALNAVVAGQWGRLDPRWNVTTHLRRHDLSRPPWAELARDPYIVHYNGAIKPWHAGYPYAFGGLFFAHLDRTPWAGWRPHRSRTARARRLGGLVGRALRRRRHEIRRRVGLARRRRAGERLLRRELPRLDDGGAIPERSDEIRLFVVVPDLAGGARERALPRWIEGQLAAGADRAFVVAGDRASGVPREALREGKGDALREGEWEALRAGERVHVFAPDAGPGRDGDHTLLLRMLHRYGRGSWCLLLEPGEELVLPDGVAAADAAEDDPPRTRNATSQSTSPLRVPPVRVPPVRVRASPLRAVCRGLEERGEGALVGRLAEVGRWRSVRWVVREPLGGRVWVSEVDVRVGAGQGERERAEGAGPVCSRVVLVRFGPEVLLSAGRVGVRGVRVAPERALVVQPRCGRAQGPRRGSTGAGR